MEISVIDPSWTVVKIKEYCKTNGIKVPSGLRKAEMIGYINGVLSEKNNKTVITNETSSSRMSDIVGVYANMDIHPLDHLDIHGWCVYPIDGWREEFVSMFFDWLEFCSPNFKRDDKSTWKTKNMVFNLHGIFKQYIGHIELLWRIREVCAPIFAEIYNIPQEDLICSFDGGCFSYPKNTKSQSWFHNDTPRGFNDVCYQGVANFVDNRENDGGLVLVEGSHLVYEEYMERNPSYGYSWGSCNMSDEGLKDIKDH